MCYLNTIKNYWDEPHKAMLGWKKDAASFQTVGVNVVGVSGMQQMSRTKIIHLDKFTFNDTN